jgi:hypothetical protein
MPLTRTRTTALLCLIALSSQAADKQPQIHYAVTDQTSQGSRGKVRMVQINESRSAAECEATLKDYRVMEPFPNAEGPAQIYCTTALPDDFASIQVGKPVARAFHVRIESGRLLSLVAGRMVTHNLFIYTFDPGPAQAVCERITKQARSRVLDTVTCTPPTAA